MLNMHRQRCLFNIFSQPEMTCPQAWLMAIIVHIAAVQMIAIMLLIVMATCFPLSIDLIIDLANLMVRMIHLTEFLPPVLVPLNLMA